MGEQEIKRDSKYTRGSDSERGGKVEREASRTIEGPRGGTNPGVGAGKGKYDESICV
jgi:hypothetical protein